MFKDINVVEDKKAKSLSYYCTEADVLRIDDRVIRELIDISIVNGHCNTRINLHASPDAKFHEMVIVQYVDQ